MLTLDLQMRDAPIGLMDPRDLVMVKECHAEMNGAIFREVFGEDMHVATLVNRCEHAADQLFGGVGKCWFLREAFRGRERYFITADGMLKFSLAFCGIEGFLIVEHMQCAIGKMMKIDFCVSHQLGHLRFAIHAQPQHDLAVIARARRKAVQQKQRTPAQHMNIGAWSQHEGRIFLKHPFPEFGEDVRIGPRLGVRIAELTAIGEGAFVRGLALPLDDGNAVAAPCKLVGACYAQHPRTQNTDFHFRDSLIESFSTEKFSAMTRLVARKGYPVDIENIVILTGAGISAESGLATFRASDGLWCGHRVEDVATPEAYERNPALVQEFYNTRRAQLKEVEPNAAHHALAKLAANWRGNLLLVTQNVDDLHDRAHATITPASGFRLIHMHGELKKARCRISEEVSDCDGDLSADGILRPHIVWFGEMPLEMDNIDRALRNCDLFVSIGTSGNVYPAAGFVAQARFAGAHTLEMNLEPSLTRSQFAEARHGKATELVPKWVEEMLR